MLEHQSPKRRFDWARSIKVDIRHTLVYITPCKETINYYNNNTVLCRVGGISAASGVILEGHFDCARSFKSLYVVFLITKKSHSDCARSFKSHFERPGVVLSASWRAILICKFLDKSHSFNKTPFKKVRFACAGAYKLDFRSFYNLLESSSGAIASEDDSREVE